MDGSRCSIGQDVPRTGAVSSSLIIANCCARAFFRSGLSVFRDVVVFSLLALNLPLVAFKLSLFVFDSGKMRRDLLGREHLPDRRHETRQLLREGAMLGRRFGKVQQLLADEIIECRLESVTLLDGASGLALLHPELVKFAGLSHSKPP
ncbi:MAG: hypothetical protein WB820_16425 [Rhodoplanes sp.]